MFVKPKTAVSVPPAEVQVPLNETPLVINIQCTCKTGSYTDNVDYQSDHPGKNDTEYEADDDEGENMGMAGTKQKLAESPRTRQKLDVPYHEWRKQLQIQWLEERTKALVDLEKLLKLTKTTFVGGEQELRAYVCLNKWTMNSAKLAQKKCPASGLKQYMEVELFPHVHLKVGQGISLSTACRWLHLEGFH
ncbi:hypothetical protein M405DRAFT_847326 [Rhizopogon salebrosus TDB-379]|nr:hypothetical protein M405DRAFT_847326 [Rhizopogon salebrosus TDB-379]